MEKVAELTDGVARTERAICVMDDWMYIIDGNALYRMQVKRETFWEWLLKKLGFQQSPTSSY